MMKKLLLILTCLATFSVAAQTQTVTIDWSFGSNSDVTPTTDPTNADRTIEVGDTVIWNYYATGTHTVTSASGSTETWDSGFISSGAGVTYQRTFTSVGTNPYVCTPHSGNMYGVITVVPEGSLSVSTFEEASKKINIYPNPASNQLNINLPSLLEGEYTIDVFNVLGKKIFSKNTSGQNNKIPVLDWDDGVYLIKITSEKEGKSITKKFVKI